MNIIINGLVWGVVIALPLLLLLHMLMKPRNRK